MEIELNLKDVSLEYKNPFFSVAKIDYSINNVNKTHYVVPSLGGVMIIVYNKDIDKFIMIKQFRFPVLFNYQNDGFLVEFCAGRIDDSDKSVIEYAIDEVMEELGYVIKEEDIQFLEKMPTCVGLVGAPIFIFYAVVDNSMKINNGGGDENEILEVIELSKQELSNLIIDQNITPITKYLIMRYCLREVL